MEYIAGLNARQDGRLRQAIGHDAGPARVDVVYGIELEDLRRQEVDRDRKGDGILVLPEGMIDGRECQCGWSVLELEGGGIHGDEAEAGFRG